VVLNRGGGQGTGQEVLGRGGKKEHSRQAGGKNLVEGEGLEDRRWGQKREALGILRR
jgi:hypothetical protein